MTTNENIKKFCLNIKNAPFLLQVWPNTGAGCPREVVEPPFLEVLKTQCSPAPGNMLWLCLLEPGQDEATLGAPAQFSCSAAALWSCPCVWLPEKIQALTEFTSMQATAAVCLPSCVSQTVTLPFHRRAKKQPTNQQLQQKKTKKAPQVKSLK